MYREPKSHPAILQGERYDDIATTVATDDDNDDIDGCHVLLMRFVFYGPIFFRFPPSPSPSPSSSLILFLITIIILIMVLFIFIFFIFF